MNNYEVIVMITEEHLAMFEKMLPFCLKNIKPKRIYAVANTRIKERIECIDGVCFVDENSVYEGLNFERIMDIIEEQTGERKRAGWYLQQFLKMAWAYKCKDDYYISLDADTFILNPVNFKKDDRYLFTPKSEYHKPYFETMEKLFNGKVQKKADFSFIAENMIFDCCVMKQMIAEIENNSEISGTTFFEKILHAIGRDNILFSGFSEFETYGNYILTKYPNKVEVRKLRTMRESLVLLGPNPSKEQLEWAANDYDIISIESTHYKKTFITWLTSKRFVRSKISMRRLAKVRYKLRTVYRRIIGKQDFVLEKYE